MSNGHSDDVLIEALGIAQRLGVIGDTDLTMEIEHARQYVLALAEISTGSTIVDIGSGGGLPGLVIAHDRPDLHVTLMDRREKRTDILRRQAGRLRRGRSGEPITVLCVDVAELIPSDGGFHAVTARSFGEPALTARLAARLLAPGGILVVSDPPGVHPGDRWGADTLVGTGLTVGPSPDGANITVMTRDPGVSRETST